MNENQTEQDWKQALAKIQESCEANVLTPESAAYYKAKERRELIERTKRKAGLGERYWDCKKPSDFASGETLEKVKSFIEMFMSNKRPASRQKPWLYIYGGYGSGKTSLAAAISHYLIAHNVRKHTTCVVDENEHALVADAERLISVVFATPHRWFMDMQAKISTYNGETYDKVFYRYADSDLLVLDDFAKSNLSEWRLSMMFDLLNCRNETGGFTIFTSNIEPLEKLYKKLLQVNNDDDAVGAICSRIKGNCALVELKGPDFRTL